MADWEPIRTAPRDGSPLLGWNGREIRIIAWSGSDWSLIPLSGDLQAWPAMEWQPLPKAPGETPSDPPKA